MLRFALLIALLLALVPFAFAEGDEKPAVPKIDVGAVLRKSEKFAGQCKAMNISYSPGVVRAVGEIAYRGGGPCEFLVSVFPAKSHETIVLLDNGPWNGEGARPREGLKDYATILNNAFLAAGFPRGTPFTWDENTGEVFPPKGKTVHLYAEWTDPKTKKAKRALMSDWLWNFKTVHVMEPSFVYTGSLLIEHDGKKFLGAELDGLVAAVLNSGTAIVDSREDGSLDNGAYEAIPIRIPETGTRVTFVSSLKELECEKFEPLKLNDELRKSRAEYLAKKKLEAEGKGPKAPKLTEDPNAGAPKGERPEEPEKPKEDGDE